MQATMQYLLASLFIGCYLLGADLGAQTVRMLPATVADHSTLWLACGEVYSGELKLIEARQVTIRTVGTCGSATLTPAQPVHQWARDTQ